MRSREDQSGQGWCAPTRIAYIRPLPRANQSYLTRPRYRSTGATRRRQLLSLRDYSFQNTLTAQSSKSPHRVDDNRSGGACAAESRCKWPARSLQLRRVIGKVVCRDGVLEARDPLGGLGPCAQGTEGGGIAGLAQGTIRRTGFEFVVYRFPRPRGRPAGRFRRR